MANRNTINPADIGTAISEWTEEHWARYAGQILVIQVDVGTERETFLDTIAKEEDLDRNQYPDAEMIELFPVPTAGGIALKPE